MTETAEQSRFVVCINNDGYEASLERRKLYRVVPDPSATRYDMIRVIDESGEDYLYDSSHFATVSLRQEVKAKLARSA